MEYGITAAATLASALLGVAFSLGAVRREQGRPGPVSCICWPEAWG